MRVQRRNGKGEIVRSALPEATVWLNLQRSNKYKKNKVENHGNSKRHTGKNASTTFQSIENLRRRQEELLHPIPEPPFLTLTLKDVRLLGLGKVISATLPPSKSAISVQEAWERCKHGFGICEFWSILANFVFYTRTQSNSASR